MRKLERIKFEKIIKVGSSGDWKDDNVLKGLQIIASYFPEDTIVLQGAEHDIIYSVDVDELLDAGLTEENAIKLKNLNWTIYNDYLACYV